MAVITIHSDIWSPRYHGQVLLWLLPVQPVKDICCWRREGGDKGIPTPGEQDVLGSKVEETTRDSESVDWVLGVSTVT